MNTNKPEDLARALANIRDAYLIFGRSTGDLLCAHYGIQTKQDAADPKADRSSAFRFGKRAGRILAPVLSRVNLLFRACGLVFYQFFNGLDAGLVEHSKAPHQGKDSEKTNQHHQDRQNTVSIG